MNKTIYLFLFFLLLANCSLNKNSKFWTSSEKINEEKIEKFKEIFSKEKALSNRSIIADARNPNIKEIINSKIKRRESFRPFAPSILFEKTQEWFQIENEVPFMSEVYPIKEDKLKLLPGITHVDGTGRLQTVKKSNNLKYYNLINSFYELTGVPIILNTSFASME